MFFFVIEIFEGGLPVLVFLPLALFRDISGLIREISLLIFLKGESQERLTDPGEVDKGNLSTTSLRVSREQSWTLGQLAVVFEGL